MVVLVLVLVAVLVCITGTCTDTHLVFSFLRLDVTFIIGSNFVPDLGKGHPLPHHVIIVGCRRFGVTQKSCG